MAFKLFKKINGNQGEVVGKKSKTTPNTSSTKQNKNNKKTPNQTDIIPLKALINYKRRKLLNIIKITYQKKRANIVLNSEALEVFLLKLEIRKRHSLLLCNSALH